MKRKFSANLAGLCSERRLIAILCNHLQQQKIAVESRCAKIFRRDRSSLSKPFWKICLALPQSRSCGIPEKTRNSQFGLNRLICLQTGCGSEFTLQRFRINAGWCLKFKVRGWPEHLEFGRISGRRIKFRSKNGTNKTGLPQSVQTGNDLLSYVVVWVGKIGIGRYSRNTV